MKRSTPASDRARELGLGRRSEQCANAARVIQNMGPDAIPFLLQVLDEQTRIIQRRRIYPYLSLASSICSVLLLGSLFMSDQPARSGLLLIPFLHLTYLFLVPWFLTNRSLRIDAGVLFAHLATREQVGTLIDLMEHGKDESTRAVHRALTRIFSQMQASDAHYLSTAHRKKLARQLARFHEHRKATEVEFILALLRALQQVGDSSFIEPVELLIEQGSDSIGRRIQPAAKECLPYLQFFAEQEAKSGTLVRAVTTPVDEQASSRLVRPAATRPDVEPAVLLRSASREEAE